MFSKISETFRGFIKNSDSESDTIQSRKRKLNVYVNFFNLLPLNLNYHVNLKISPSISLAVSDKYAPNRGLEIYQFSFSLCKCVMEVCLPLSLPVRVNKRFIK